ncbi:MAG: NAD(P)-dependent glycerol-3-phosphate dehydrogenase [Chloroflexota bacterium]|nr:NAD(P)-dependent glycerol-3-phosphate dehydrogenase [Chloroflexota bacterium]MDE2961001.1 NAD(P)-dependent glycerol-3-phosphate dehydrogenase [Chloroflexota bacterium]
MPPNSPLPTAVLGATTWGTTLAVLAARGGAPVRLLCRTDEEAEALRHARQHARRLPGVPFPDTLSVEHDPAVALGDAGLVIIAVPSDRFRQNIRRIAGHVPEDAVVLSVTKGLELPAGLRMSEVLEQELPAHSPSRFAVLSGPNLAGEVIAGKPALTVVASQDEASRRLAQDTLMSPTFRVYTSDDVVGVELGGSLKNIIALAAGIADGLDAGANAKAALVTRGLNEIGRLGIAAGAELLTFAGLAGLGDVMATCNSPLSRNRRVGEELARGRQLPDILIRMGAVAEGVNTTVAALEIAERLEVDMPITRLMSQVLFEGLPAADCIPVLMERPPRSEW